MHCSTNSTFIFHRVFLLFSLHERIELTKEIRYRRKTLSRFFRLWHCFVQSVDVLVCVCLFVQQINTDYHRCVVFHSMRNCHCMINGTKTVNFLCFCRLVGCIFIIQRPHLKLTLSLRVSPSQFKFQMHEIRALRLWNQFNGLLLFIVWRSLNFIFTFMYLRLR